MPGNSFGEIFRITTFGESHGPGVGVIVDGVPPNIPILAKDIQFDLNRRKPGQSHVTTPRNEADQVEILSGVFKDRSTGTPIALLVRNKDQKSYDYEKLKNIFRPGHADYTYLMKYGIRDFRGSGRSSGRETVGRVAAGAIAKKILNSKGIYILAYTLSIGGITAERVDASVIEKNPVRAPDLNAAKQMVALIEELKSEGDSVGGVIETVVKRCPIGLGDPVFDKLNAKLAHALLSIGAIRGIEFGAGFKAAKMKGSEHNDHYYAASDAIQMMGNNAGGILGGISTGKDIVLRVAVKPTSSINKTQETVDVDGNKISLNVEGRHDPCICPRIVPVIEAMVAITILDSLLLQKTTRSLETQS